MVVIICSLVPSHAEERFEKPGTKGWWWYEPVHTKEEPDAIKKEKPEQIMFEQYTYDELWNMHPDEFSALFDNMQKQAVMTLKENDVRDFYYLVDIARKKSLAFANVASYVIQKNPALNVRKDYPSNYMGRMAMLETAKADLTSLISEASNHFALLYFFEPSCHYCEAQDEIMDVFQSMYGWQVRRININEEYNLKQHFAVDMVPSVILIYRENSEYLPVSVGVVSLDEFQSRLYRSIRMLKGDVSAENFTLYEYQKGSSFDSGKSGGMFEKAIHQNRSEIQ